MSASLAAAPPSTARLGIPNASPLHLQLLLMMGSCHNNPTIMAEAEQVQKLLLSIEPESDGQSSTSAAPKKKGSKPAVKSSSSSSSSTPAATIAAPSDDPSVPWSKPALAALESSTEPGALLKLALLHDPANPWQLHLRDVEKAIKYYGLAAIKMPSTYACARLAHFYITGDFVAGGKDLVKGAKWLRMGASKGHALCQYQLGFLYEEGGMGVSRDIKQAVEWYKKAADLKYPPAMYNLATILLESEGTYEKEGIEQDIYTGIRLMEDAAALGDSSSQLKLGHLCFLGNEELEIEASIDRCIQYLTMAVYNENEPSVDAAKILGIIYSTAETNTYENPHYDIEKSIKFLKIAADSGHADSKILLQRQMAKRSKIQSGMVIDHHSQHLEAVRKLQAQQEGVVMATVVDEGKEASKNLTSTPSPDSLFLALARIHSRFPEYGSARLHQCIKGEYPHWEVSEKRIKKVMKENNWAAENAVQAIVLESAATPAATVSSPQAQSAAAATTAMNNIRINEKAIVNDLD